MAKDCAGMELNGQFFEIAKSFVILVTQKELERVQLTVL